jgi:hypothetical protein
LDRAPIEAALRRYGIRSSRGGVSDVRQEFEELRSLDDRKRDRRFFDQLRRHDFMTVTCEQGGKLGAMTPLPPTTTILMLRLHGRSRA